MQVGDLVRTASHWNGTIAIVVSTGRLTTSSGIVTKY